jgi:alanine-glyoxylate transaminase/serine-glyoxylate transaminase/serine-pyruvate transaminase
MIYALCEALRIVKEEGLENRWKRYQNNCRAFLEGINALGLKAFAQEGYRLPPLSTITIPTGIIDTQVRNMLLNQYNIEIGGGLGVLKNKIWRVGLMGLNSTEQNVVVVLEALERALKDQRYEVGSGKGVSAVINYYDSN